MKSHYFIEDKTLKSNPQSFNYHYKSKKYTFTTDNGVFSAGKMDQNTDLLLRNLPALSGSLLDMGCGFGCIGIVLAKEYDLKLTQTDINPTAIKLTIENCNANDVATNAFVSDCFENISDYFDTIIINPPIHAGKQIMFDMYEGSFLHLNENGKLYIVILKKHGAESSIAKLMQVFGNCDVIYNKKGCYILCCTKK
jgi:16S rRNA (guanine1207-N2)-methyltransferase